MPLILIQCGEFKAELIEHPKLFIVICLKLLILNSRSVDQGIFIFVHKYYGVDYHGREVFCSGGMNSYVHKISSSGIWISWCITGTLLSESTSSYVKLSSENRKAYLARGNPCFTEETLKHLWNPVQISC